MVGDHGMGRSLETETVSRIGQGAQVDAEPKEALVELFRRVASSVPAYRAFLRDHGVDPAAVRTAAEVRSLPVLTKDNYLRAYPLPALCRGGRLAAGDLIAVSSGSTGQPTFWPRSAADEIGVVNRFEQVFRDAFGAAERSTLAVVCFPLGTWVGGLYTLSCVRQLAARGYPITAVAPGKNKAEILRVVPELGRHVDQVVLLGYPPFVKDVIDSGLAVGVDWPRYSIKLVLAGEVFSEEWRDLVGIRAGLSRPCFDSAALYGTADAGVLGNETPLSVTIRRFLAGRPDLARELFGGPRLPTLVQYDPLQRFFETHEDGTLLFSADNTIPLIRYHIADEGGLLGHDELLGFCRQHGFDPQVELASVEGAAPRLPFCYVFGRSFHTVSYFGANVYPENVTVGLEQPPVAGWVTGKFVVEAIEDADRNRRLRITTELAPGQRADADRAALVAGSIRAQLCRLNSEFAHYVPAERQLPEVVLRPTGDPEYFPIGVKHRYTRSSKRLTQTTESSP
jgi:phenylacetate-CoA ligase